MRFSMANIRTLRANGLPGVPKIFMSLLSLFGIGLWLGAMVRHGISSSGFVCALAVGDLSSLQ
jgi:hypothetical protein